MNREQLQQIRDALQGACPAYSANEAFYREALAILDAELAAPEQRGWTLLLTGEHYGLVGKLGEKFDSSPSHYDRVDVYTAPVAAPQREWACKHCGENNG